MMPLTTLEGQTDLPRYFASVFRMGKALEHGRMDFHLADGRVFRIEAPASAEKRYLYGSEGP